MANQDLGANPNVITSTTDSYRRYVLILLFSVYVFNFLDRQILSILMPLIKADLDLSDTQLGLLSGLAFALFYSTLGIPIARMADHGTARRSIIAASLAIWSLMTSLSGMAGNFWQLMIYRVGVGVGEAGCSPSAHSLISDYFPADRRGTAMSVYSLGIPVGVLLGFLFGGAIGEAFGWRWAFVVIGVPGILLALLVRFTLKEPVRGMSDGGAVADETMGFGEVFRKLWAKRTFRHLSLAAALHAFVGYGVGQFVPTFMFRTHELGIADIGWILAPIVGIAGGLGTFLGGFMTDRLQKRDIRWIVWVPGISTFLALPFAFPTYLSNDLTIVVIAMIPPALLGFMYLGPTFALTQGMVSLRMRAMAAAILLLIINLVGLGLGPTAVGMVSDLFSEIWGQDGLRYTLLTFGMVNLWSTLHYFLAGRTIETDLAKE